MKSTRRRSLLALLGASASAAIALPIVATTVTGAPPLPDLIAQQAGPPGAQLYKDGRLLLRFDGFVPNAGAGDLEIRASAPNGADQMTNVAQWAGMPSAGTGGENVTMPTKPRVQFEQADDHNHYHLKNAAEYTLRTPDGAAQVAIAQKTEAGFCLEDSQTLAGGPPTGGTYSADLESQGGNNFCWQDHDNVGSTLVMGISSGYRDVYGAWLSYQWVDASAVQPGVYRIGTRVDPDNVIRESSESNNGYSLREAIVPGYVAKPQTVPLASSVSVPLEANAYTAESYPTDANGDAAGQPGTRRFKILTGPKRGSINLPVGQELNGSPTVTYTPNPGSNLTDSFTYIAYYRATADDGVNRTYPANPAPATVTIAGATPSVALSGAPASMIAGTSVQLSASVVNGPSGVTWSADGGSVTPTGLLTAPATPGSITVRATSADEPSVASAATIAVVAPPAKKPAQSATLSAGNKKLSPLRITSPSKRKIVAKVATGAKGGTVTFTATLGRAVLAKKAYKVGARKTVTFRVTLKRNYNLKKVRITAKYTRGATTAVRRSFVAR